MRPFPFATVGFDLDGTLLDTSGDLAAAVNHALVVGERAPMTAAELMPLVGGGARHLLGQALAASGDTDEAETDRLLPLLLAYYEANIDTHTRPFPHAIATVDALRARGITCAIVTNKREDFARPLLLSLGLLDRFACVIGGDTLGADRAKPAPTCCWRWSSDAAAPPCSSATRPTTCRPPALPRCRSSPARSASRPSPRLSLAPTR